MEPYPADVISTELEIHAAMLRLIEIDPNALVRIEKIFERVKNAA